MAKSFIYPNANLLTATLTDGTFAADVFTPSSSVTNEERINDMSIGSAVGSFGLNDVIRIDLGASPGTIDTFTFYSNQVDANFLVLYGSNSATDMATAKATFIDGLALGWNVDVTLDDNLRYWFIRATDGTLDGITEIILGTKYTFDITPNTGIVEGKLSGSDINKSYGAVEYSYKRHELIKTWDWQWDVPTTAIKTSLEAIETAVDLNYKKLIYYDGTTYYWVRIQPNSFKFTWQAYNFWTTPMSLVQQLQ